MAIIDRLQHAWNAFTRNAFDVREEADAGASYSRRPDRVRMTIGNERSIVSAIYTRIAVDVSAVSIKHVRVDDNERYLDTIRDNLNDCITLSANIDQTGKALIQDIIMSLIDEGSVAVVPVDTTVNPDQTDSYEILSMRTGKITQWYPRHVKVHLYNDKTGLKEDVILPKEMVAIIENPFYSVMNEPNSTLKRLIYKLNLLDAVDEQSSSGKLDLIIQLPYVIKTEERKKQAEKRRKDVEFQLKGSKYGIAYIDGTEKVTQLNRPVENQLMKQIEYLTSMLYSQLSMSDTILNGTADEKTRLNYYSSTLEPYLTAIRDEFKRKFLTKAARTQGQSILYFKDSFKLVPLSEFADIADKLTRNEVLSSNEIRAELGYKPDSNPKSDELRNKNITPKEETAPIPETKKPGLKNPQEKEKANEV